MRQSLEYYVFFKLAMAKDSIVIGILESEVYLESSYTLLKRLST